jgi:hypothetical protein
MPERRQIQPEMPHTRISTQFTVEESQAIVGAAATLGEHPGDFIRRIVTAEVTRLQADPATVNKGRTKKKELEHKIADLSGQLEGVTVFLAGANPRYQSSEAPPVTPTPQD